jgi:cyclic pyranopterin phosphate synthase
MMKYGNQRRSEEDGLSLLMDRDRRTVRKLRLSVTDRCNLRCSYCMPPEGVP